MFWAAVALLLPEVFVLGRYLWRRFFNFRLVNPQPSSSDGGKPNRFERRPDTDARWIPVIVAAINGKDGKWSTSTVCGGTPPLQRRPGSRLGRATAVRPSSED